MFNIINSWNTYKNEINFAEFKKHQSFANMFWYFETTMLHSLIREIKPTKIIEFGCHKGFTSYVILNALKINNIKSELFSFDIIPDSEYLNCNNNVSRKLITGDLRDSALNFMNECDFVFIDADHTFELGQWYCQQIFPFLESGVIIVSHDWEESAALTHESYALKTLGIDTK